MDVDVSVELLADAKVVTFAIKFSSPSFELNVYVPQSQLELLRKAASTPWAQGSIQIGECAGALAFWSAGEPNTVAVMVGRDDQTWDFSVQLPVSAINLALREAASCTSVAGQA